MQPMLGTPNNEEGARETRGVRRARRVRGRVEDGKEALGEIAGLH